MRSDTSHGLQCWLKSSAARQGEQEQVILRCNFSAVKVCATRASCTLISKCDITSLSSLYKDCVEVLKGALYTVKH